MKLLGLSTLGLVFGRRICLFALRMFCLKLVGNILAGSRRHDRPVRHHHGFCRIAAIARHWALASRWIKISLLYGALGIGYWLALLFLGKSPAALLQTMPVAAGLAFGALFLVWLIAMRPHKTGEPAQS